MKGVISGGEVVSEVCLQKYQDFSGYFSKHTSLLFHPAIPPAPQAYAHICQVLPLVLLAEHITYLPGFKSVRRNENQ